MDSDFANLEFHNFAGLKPASGWRGLELHRFPEHIRTLTGAQSPLGGEIRFVTAAPEVKVHFAFCAPDTTSGSARIRVYRGDCEQELAGSLSLKPGRITTIVIPGSTMLDRMRPETIPARGFAPQVWRIAVDEMPTVVFCGLDTAGYPVRKPFAEEKPRLKYLALSGSVGQFGFDVFSSIAARRLGLDRTSFAMAGRNVWQDEYVDYVSSVADEFDIITFMYGLNVIPKTPPDEIKRRMRNMLAKLTAKRPERPVLALPTYDCNLDRLADPERDPYFRPYLELKQVFAQAVSEFAVKANVHSIPGNSLMDDSGAIYTDGLHLGVYGQVLLGIRLADVMEGYLK